MLSSFRSFWIIALAAGCFFSGSVVVRAEASSSAALVPLILRTSEGRFLDIRSGTSGATEAEVLARVAGTWMTPEPSPVPIVTAPVPVPSVVPNPSVVDATSPAFLQGLTAPPAVLAARRARGLLEAGKEPIVSSTKKPSDWRTVVLALWNKDTDEIRLVSFEKNGASLRGVPSDLQIRILGGSGFDTDYAITPPNLLVVGERYPILDTTTEKKKTTYTLRPLVYVPSESSLRTPAVLDWGKIVLDRLVNNVVADLRQQAIPSRAFPGTLLADATDPVVLKSIMAIEQMDRGSVRTGADNRLDLFYLELAMNEDHAFHYEVSSAGANGLLQFIPSTYASVVSHWPHLHLIKDFKTGMADLPNAIRAQIAYLDGVWSDLPAAARDPRVTSPEAARAYLIAAYNTGGVRVRRAISKFGEAWDQDYRAQWDKLDAKQTELAMAINRTKKKVAAEKVASKKKALQKDLAQLQTQHAQVTSQLTTLDQSRLKAETIGYLQKYRLIAPRMKQSIAVAMVAN